ncbi:hypothetical protein ACWDOP_05120 [Nocardia sp. NPDC003693]
MAARCCADPLLTRILLLERRGVPHGQPAHAAVFDYTEIGRCAACGGGVVEHFSHDCWESEHSEWDKYWWWRIDVADMRLLIKMTGFCPAPLDAECTCSLHRNLSAETPRPLPPSVETAAEDAVVPRVGVRVIGGVPRWEAVEERDETE